MRRLIQEYTAAVRRLEGPLRQGSTRNWGLAKTLAKVDAVREAREALEAAGMSRDEVYQWRDNANCGRIFSMHLELTTEV